MGKGSPLGVHPNTMLGVGLYAPYLLSVRCLLGVLGDVMDLPSVTTVHQTHLYKGPSTRQLKKKQLFLLRENSYQMVDF